MNLNEIKALVIDMDGVLWRGDTPLPGLQSLFIFLDEQSIPFTLATNNSSKTVQQYQKKFAKFGVTIQTDKVMTSSLATADYLRNELEPGSRVYVVGEDGIRDAITQAGFLVLEDLSEPAQAVACGIDSMLTYDKLKYAALHIRRGAKFVGTNGDKTLPTEEGLYPGTGSILAAIEAATGIEPAIIGKPEPFIFSVALKKMGSNPAQTAMIGDRLETDILGAQRAGLKTILVKTGVDNEESITEKGIQPDAIYSGIDELVDVWQNSS